MNRRSKPTRYVSIILLLCFTVTSSYGTVGLQTTPLSNLGNDLKYDGADKWWLRQMVAQADRVDHPPKRIGYQSGYSSGVAYADSTVSTGKWLLGSALAIPLTYGIGTLILWRLAGPSQIPAVAFEDIHPISKEYIAGFEQGFEQRSKQKKVKAVQSAALVVVLSVVVTGALMAILVPWESQEPKAP